MRGELVGFYPAKDAATDAGIDPVLLLDLVILIDTVSVVLFGEGQ
jgi:hypothetical protein